MSVLDKKYFFVASTKTPAILLFITALLLGCSNEKIKSSKEDVSVFREIIERSISEQKEFLPQSSSQKIEEEYFIESQVIFDAFWTPQNLKQYGDLQWGHDLYKKAEYLIVQTELSVAVRITTDWPTNLMRAISSYDPFNPRHPKDGEWVFHKHTNFISNVKFKNCKVLHLTPEVKDRLEDFLGAEFTEFSTPSIMTPARAKDKSAQRLAAANTLITIFPDHWGNGWHFISHPKIEMILLNHNLNQAIVIFRIGYEGGYASLKKEKDDWILIESIMWWVE